MAENNSPKTNTGILAKAQKRLSRTKTKVLQNLGKADKTKDEAFNNNVSQIEELQERIHPLHKELHQYMVCAKNLNQASKNLQNSFQTVYEDDWPEKELVLEHFKTYELLWSDYLQNLQDSVTNPLNSFFQHFPAFKSKISKRGRKLVDYDNARHQLEVLNAAKKRDEAKIEKATEDLKEAKKIYEELNHELLVEMPAFYKSRCHFISTLYTSLFGTDFVFHSEIGKVSASVGDACQKLASQSEPMDFKLNTSMSANSENGTSGMSSPTSAAGQDSPLYLNQKLLEEKQVKRSQENNINGEDGDDDDNDKDNEEDDTDSEVVPLQREDSPASSKLGSLKGSQEPQELQEPLKEEGNYVKGHDEEGNGDDNDSDDDDNNEDKVSQVPKEKSEGNLYEEPASPIISAKGKHGLQNGKGIENNDKDDDDNDDDNDEDEDDEAGLYTDTPINIPVHEPPPGTLYQVQATHRYTGEDVDELNFEPGEMIYVIQFENPEEQDDGWQMGIKQADGIKGVFPENFTRKI